MRNKITFLLKMADCVGKGRARRRAGQLRSFKEGWSNVNKRIHISKKTFAEWQMLRSRLCLYNDDEVANYFLNHHRLESCSKDGQLRLEYTV